MRTALCQATIATGILVAVFVAPEREVYAQASSTVGSVRGQVRDKATGEAAIGATIVATSPALVGEQVVLADESGLYFLTALPPGSYTLTVYYNDGTFTRGNVTIQVGKEAVVNITVDSASTSGRPKGETIEIEGTAPVIDQGSTKTGLSITEEFTNNIPVGRTFGQVLNSASGSQNDFYGTSLSGATSVENSYVIEGINTTDTGFGRLSSNLPNEFVQETEVITGGYNAEYGRATGGIVNVVTKQGSNEFHGSVFAHYTPGQLSATAKDIEKEGGSIAYGNNLDYSYDVGAEIGGPIIKDKLWFHIGFNPSRIRSINTRTVQTQIDENDDGTPDFNPSTGITLHRRISSIDIPEARSTYYFTGKVNGEINQNNQFQLSIFGNPRTGNESVDIRNTTASFAPDNFLIDRNEGAYDIAGKYTSKFNNGQTQIDGVAGLHRGYRTSDTTTPSSERALVFYNYTRSLFDFADIEGVSTIAQCNDNDPSDPYKKIQNCPVFQYTEQGLGGLEDRTNDRLSAILSITQRVKLAGYHVLKAGADIERSTYNSDLQLTGGATYRRNCNVDPTTEAPVENCDDPSALPATWRVFRYAHVVRNLEPDEILDPDSVMLEPGQQIVNCAGDTAICGPDPGRKADTHNRSIGLYAQDSWQIRPNLTINAGIRFEQQKLYNADQMVGLRLGTGEVVSDTAFTLNNWAPRLGAIYDPTSEGKSKLYAHWGRFYENIPGDINVRSFGGEINDIHRLNVTRRVPSDQGFDPNCFVNHMPGEDPSSKLRQCVDADDSDLLGGGGALYAAPVDGQYTDEIVLGAEYELVPDMKVALTYTHRTIPTVIEDVSSDGANNYMIANPGRNYDSVAADLEEQAAAAMADGNTALFEKLSSQASSLRFVKRFDKPARTYDALTLRVEQRPSRASLVIASYTFAQTRGNYPGLFSTETNQLDPNITSLYDLPDLMANRYGPLGLDRPHNLKLDGFYQFDLKSTGIITLGSSVRVQSGLAHNALAAHPVYGDGESYLLPRGSIERSPVTSNVDFHVSYGRRLDRNMVVEGFIRAFNVFDQQDETNVDENYTFDNALPIVGGDAEDLRHAKSLPDGAVMVNQSLSLNRNFNNTSALTVPRSFQFGVRMTF